MSECGNEPVRCDGGVRSQAGTSDRLQRVLGIGFGVVVTIGNTIGGGILRTPGAIAARLPTPGLIAAVWLAGGVYSLLAANALAELGTMLPRAGAQYAYARYALGPYAGFIVGWTDWAAQCGSAAALTIVVAGSLVVLVPALGPHTVTVAVVIVTLLTVVLWRGVRWSDRIQGFTSLLKGLAFAVLLVACFAAAGRRATAVGSLHLASPIGLHLGLAFVLAFQAVLFTYDGWAGALYFGEELRDPGLNVPRALFGSLAIVIILYILVNVAFLAVLPLSTLAGAAVPAAAAAHTIAGVRGDVIVHGLIVVTLVSSVIANLLIASRVSFALARDGLLPRVGARVNAGGTPEIALGASAAIAIAFLLSGTFETVIAVLAIFFVLEYVFSFTSLFILRRREPTMGRPWRAWGHPWTTGFVLVGSVVFLLAAVAGDPWHSAGAAGVVALSYPVYRLRERAATQSQRLP